jgi:hypothetical protein
MAFGHRTHCSANIGSGSRNKTSGLVRYVAIIDQLGIEMFAVAIGGFKDTLAWSRSRCCLMLALGNNGKLYPRAGASLPINFVLPILFPVPMLAACGIRDIRDFEEQV